MASMFRASPPNPYDELVLKATDEAQTSENWSILIEVCDKLIADTSPSGPRDCIASIQKRLQHRNANVQLFCLTLTEALVKNTNEGLHKEVASRAFMKVLSTLVSDRYTHEKVKKRILQCLRSWADDFHGKPNLGLVEDTVDQLRSKGHRHEEDSSPVTHPPDEVLKREEEDLQRALAESEREAEWANMAGVGNFPSGALDSQPAVGPTGYLPSSSSQSRLAAQPASSLPYDTSRPGSQLSAAAPNNYQAPAHELGRLSLHDSSQDVSLHPPTGTELYPMRTKGRPAPRRVKALYDFEPSEEGELAFKEGDLIRVIDSAYKDWWKGELRGVVGIFPVNYVEPIPDPSPESLARELEAEAAVFAQAHEIDRLLQMLRTLDAKRDNLADNDELSELYQQTLSLRPKIVRLIEKYTQKKAELLQINSKFMKAKATYDAMLEENLAKHHPGVAADAYAQPNPAFRPPASAYGSPSMYPPTSYGYDQVSSGPAYAGQQPHRPSQQPYVQQRPAGAPQSMGQHAYPLRTNVPDGIDTSRYYLASDGNWYAYSAEQLAASQPAAAAPTPAQAQLPDPSESASEGVGGFTRPAGAPWNAYPGPAVAPASVGPHAAGTGQ